jgi:hypothetical protein
MNRLFTIFSGMLEKNIIRDINLWFDSPSVLSLHDFDEEGLRSCEWYVRACAEALLFSKTIGLETPELTDEWKKLRPFGDGTPSLDEFWNCTGIEIACACFPTIVKGADKALVWRIYVVNKSPFAEGQDHRHFLSDTAWIGDHQSVFLSCDFQGVQRMIGIDGNSWQLAFAMAEMATRRENKRKELACNWLLTGKVQDQAVKDVTIGAKDDLFKQTKRSILIPEGNKDDLLASKSKNGIHFVSSTEQAWRIISGEGIDIVSDVQLPVKPKLHILVGGTKQPVFSVILLLNPSHVTLWHSEQTRQNAELIRDTLRSIPEFQAEEIRLESMDSHNLSEAYSQFDKSISQSASDSIISNTGGNRLMGIASLLVAQTHNVKVVYRDVDAENDSVTVIQFGEKSHYQSNDYSFNRCPFREKINWNWLYNRPTPGESLNTVEDIKKQLFLPDN